MNRPRIDLPVSFPFSTELPVRITDINYGGHLGNDKVLTLAHEARTLFLASLGLEELAVGAGAGLIMADAAIEFKAEVHYGDILRVSVAVMNIGRAGFDIVYHFEALKAGSPITTAVARTGMVCFDYGRKKVVSIPESFRTAVASLS